MTEGTELVDQQSFRWNGYGAMLLNHRRSSTLIAYIPFVLIAISSIPAEWCLLFYARLHVSIGHPMNRCLFKTGFPKQ
jgi:hypothetical protein